MRADALAVAALTLALFAAALFALPVALLAFALQPRLFVGSGDGVKPGADDRAPRLGGAAHDGGDELRALWRTAMDRSRTLVNGLIEYQPGAMEAVHGPEGRRYSLRWILTHMVEEYARHAGHADLLRESIAGLTPP